MGTDMSADMGVGVEGCWWTELVPRKQFMMDRATEEEEADIILDTLDPASSYLRSNPKVMMK